MRPALIPMSMIPVSMLALAAPALLGAAPVGYDVSATVTGLRSGAGGQVRGQVLACLTAQPADFPDCAKDPQARARVVPAGRTVQLDFGDVPGGRYAIAIIHDENANGRMDKRLVLPTEGYGFSRDAAVRFGPPSFAHAAFAVGQAPGHDGARHDATHQSIRMRYIF